MNHVLIKVYPKDDYLAALCYESFKLAGIAANYTFFADEGEYKYITGNKDKVPVITHISFGGYSGSDGVRGMIKGLKEFVFAGDDTVIMVDADVVVRNNFLSDIGQYEHAGSGGISTYKNGLIGHISGQMQIIKGYILNRIIHDTNIEDVLNEMLSIDLSINDDTFLSYLTDKWKCDKKYLPHTDTSIAYGWYHHKFFNYEGQEISIVLNQILKLGK